jgi:hypothetical protein
MVDFDFYDDEKSVLVAFGSEDNLVKIDMTNGN